jgi:predicted transcriptional regulator
MDKKLNSDIFLSTFNDLEKYFKKEFFRGHWKSFKQMLKEGSRFNPIIKQFKEDLFEYADLRNAIVHNRSNNYTVIAEPHDFVVKHFIEIKEQIVNPLRMTAFFKKVYTCNLTDKVSYPLQLLHEKLISQMPVVDENNKVVEIINPNTIAYWIAAKKKAYTENEIVQNVICFKEFKNNFAFISADTTIFHAAEIFKNSYKEQPTGRYYDALLVTQNGNNTEKIKGIVVLSDIAKYI